jgi:DNA-binding XRE family transcriptional regulator
MTDSPAFPAVAEAAKQVLARAGGAEQLLACLEPALAAERDKIVALLARRIRVRLGDAYAAARPVGRKQSIDDAKARDNCRALADDIAGDENFLPRLVKWLSVNVAFWLWKGEAVDSIDAGSVGSLIGVYVESQVEVVTDLLTPPKVPLSRLEDILGVLRHRGEAIPPGTMLALSAPSFQSLRDALCKNSFVRTEGAPWPTARLHGGGIAQLRPPAFDDLPWLPREGLDRWADAMWRQQSELSDRDADVLDALCSLYLAKAQGPNDAVTADVAQLLNLRGLRPKKGGGGRRGGFEAEQKNEMLASLNHIQNLWIDVAEIEVMPGGRDTKTLQSRPFLITDRVGAKRDDGDIDMERFVFRPGRVFAAFLFSGAHHLLFRKALEYDPYRRRWEKRLARYFSWHWGDGGGHAHGVAALLDVVGKPVDPLYPTKTRARLEKALTTLTADHVVAGWRYAGEARPAGVAAWLGATIFVDAPEALRAYYAGKHADDDLPGRLRHARRAGGLTQAELARSLGIAQSHLSKLETGRVAPAADLRAAIEDWLAAR